MEFTDAIFVVIHVNDCYVAGTEKSISALKKGLEQTFKVKQEDNLDNYLSCNIEVNHDKGYVWIGQPHLVKKLQREFGELV